MERLTKAGKNLLVGTKQTQRAVEKGQAKVVYVAEDAEERISAPLLRLCAERGVEVVRVENMQKLGQQCGIKVGAAAAALIEQA